MAIHMFLLLLACFAHQAQALQPKGISVASERQAGLDANSVDPHSFNFADILHGRSLPQGLGGWSNIFEKLGSGVRFGPEDLSQAMEGSAGDVDPQLQQGLHESAVQVLLRNFTENPGQLVKTVQESQMIRQLEKMNPTIAQIIRSPGALQTIFSPEVIQQLQSGAPSEASLQKILSLANVSGVSNAAMPEGLKLKQIRPGDGKTFPRAGDEVVVQYKGYLKDGTAFDSGSFSFHIGSSEVIQGWDLGMKHMSLGERAVLQVPADLAYGSAGNDPIPPGADLVFDVNLREIN